MSKTATIRTRIEPGLKSEVEGILAQLGLTASAAPIAVEQAATGTQGPNARVTTMPSAGSESAKVPARR